MGEYSGSEIVIFGAISIYLALDTVILPCRYSRHMEYHFDSYDF